MLLDDLTCSWSEFQRVGTATEEAHVPAWVLAMGINKWKTDERDSLGFGAKDSIDNRYEGTPEERAW